MATQLFLRPFQANSVYDWSSGNNDADMAGTARVWTTHTLRTTRGSTATSTARTSVAGPTNGLEIGPGQHFMSPPLAADVVISGTITFNFRLLEGNGTGNGGAQCVVQRIDSQGVIQETVVNSEKGTEFGTTEAAENWTADATDTQFYKGDRIRVRVLANDAGGTMGASVGFTLWYDGPTAAASGDSYITFNETITFLTTDPTGTVLYPINAAAEVDPNGASYDAKEMWDTRGSSDSTAVTNTAAGWTAPLLATISAGGNFIEWYTRGLAAFTLGGLVMCRLRCQESNALANIAPHPELAVCNADGTLISVWASTTTNQEFDPSSSIERLVYLAGDDVAISNGQRLRFRLYLDDTQQNAMATGYTGTFRYNGAAAGAADSFLTFTQTLSEGAALSPPANLAAVAVSPTQIDLSWDNASGATSYDIEEDASTIETGYTGTHTPGSPYQRTGRSPATEYDYRVRSRNSA